MKYGKRVILGDDFVNWYNRFYEKEKWVKKSVEIEGNLYDKLKEIANEELDASVNKIIDACIDDFEIAEKVVIYRKRKDEINVARSIIIRESIYKKLEDMREKYGISISKLVNIAIRTGLESYKNK
jgi:ribbon-helix-helix protein, copG family